MKFDKKISLSSQYSTDHKNYIEKVLDFFGLRNFLFIQLATEVSNSKNKKIGAIILFPECLENIPFKGSFEFEILSSTYTDKNISDKSY